MFPSFPISTILILIHKAASFQYNSQLLVIFNDHVNILWNLYPFPFLQSCTSRLSIKFKTWSRSHCLRVGLRNSGIIIKKNSRKHIKPRQSIRSPSLELEQGGERERDDMPLSNCLKRNVSPIQCQGFVFLFPQQKKREGKEKEMKSLPNPLKVISLKVSEEVTGMLLSSLFFLINRIRVIIMLNPTNWHTIL